jgi:hypothetical protein
LGGLLAITLIAQPVLALELELFRIPKGRELVQEGETFRAFTFPEWKELLLADQQLRTQTILGTKKDSLITGLTAETLQLSKQIESYKRDAVTQKEEYDRIYLKWEKADKDLQSCKARKGLFGTVALLGGGILALVGGIAILSR